MMEAEEEGQVTRGRILIAEDDATICSTLGALLTAHGFTICMAENVAEAVALLQQEPFDLVISDYLMAGGGGEAILQAVEACEPKPGVIVITGWSDPQLAAELRQKGADCFVSKPFRISVLLETIEELLAERGKQALE